MIIKRAVLEDVMTIANLAIHYRLEKFNMKRNGL